MTEPVHKTPRDLAHTVAVKLGSGRGIPNADALEQIFQTLFFASLKAEENRSVRCYLAFASPKKPDPEPPPHIRLNRWVYTPLRSAIALTSRSLAKLALASDPLTSALAIYSSPGRMARVHGFFDQQRAFQAARRYDRVGGYGPPGEFQVRVAGFGHLIVYDGHTVLGELNDGRLAMRTQDVIAGSAVSEFFAPALDAHLQRVRQSISKQGYHFDPDDRSMVAYEWFRVIRRILVRAQDHGHGGAFIFLDRAVTDDLKPRYELHYERLRDALEAAARSALVEAEADNAIFQHVENDSETIPASAYLDSVIAAGEKDDAKEAADGAIEFIAALSRVDGAVLVGRDLTIQGFGAEILCPELSEPVYLARGDEPSGRATTDLQRFGTRHRSALRYCAAHRAALAFVVSEDGPVRAIRHVRGKLWLWDNVQLHDVKDWQLPNSELQRTRSSLRSRPRS